MNSKPKPAKPAGCTFEQKWGDDPFTALGHTQIPNALLRYAARLTLAPDECWLITCILLFKRSPADPFPGQSTLTEMYGRSVDTVQRVIKSIRAKGLLETHHKRSDLGHFDHIVYDFMPLRAALNECYYQDHPQERPKCFRTFPMPNMSNLPQISAMPQECGMAERTRQNVSHTARLRYGRDAVTHTAKQPNSMPQGCGANQTLKEKIEVELEVELKRELVASPFSEEPVSEEEPETPPRRWQDLTEAERQPLVDQAMAELVTIHAGSGIMPRPKLVEVRANALYEASLKQARS